MIKLHLNKYYLYFTFLFVAQTFVSCNLKRDFIAEEIVAVELQAAKTDSLMALTKELNIRGTTARNMADYKEALNLHFRALNLVSCQ